MYRHTGPPASHAQRQDFALGMLNLLIYPLALAEPLSSVLHLGHFEGQTMFGCKEISFVCSLCCSEDRYSISLQFTFTGCQRHHDQKGALCILRIEPATLLNHLCGTQWSMEPIFAVQCSSNRVLVCALTAVILRQLLGNTSIFDIHFPDVR